MCHWKIHRSWKQRAYYLDLIFSSIGLGYFVYGKRSSNIIVRYIGVAQMVYPYFLTNTMALGRVGVDLMLLPKCIEV